MTPRVTNAVLEERIRAQHTQVMEALDGIRAELHAQNGIVRGHSQTVAEHSQWVKDHQGVHLVVERRLNHISGKVNAVAVINTALAFIAGALGLGSK